jgi:hypothetical protein
LENEKRVIIKINIRENPEALATLGTKDRGRR